MNCTFVKTTSLCEGVSVITIDSPKTLNALNRTILEELNASVDALSKETRVLIITGEGKAFVAGADISQMRDFNAAQSLEFSQYGAMVFKKIEDLNIPVIAAVNGFALGGGCELALCCDIRIASDTSCFGQPEVKLGIIPGFSGTVRLSKLVGQGFAKELIYTGKVIKSDEAYRIGLVNSVVPLDQLMDSCRKMAEMIMANAPIAVAKAKESINTNYDLNVDDSIALENRLFSECFATKDQKEGMTAFLEKRRACFENQ